MDSKKLWLKTRKQRAQKAKLPQHRKFGAINYELVDVPKTKKPAEDWADWNRRVNNYNVRIQKVDAGYAIWAKKKPAPTKKKRRR